MPAYRAVVFDFFGTLTRSVRRGPHHGDVARLLGCDPEAMVGVLDRSFRTRARGALGSAEATLRWVGEQAGAAPQPCQVRQALDARMRALQADTVLRPEAVSTLQELRRRGLRIGLLSDCTHELPVLLPRLPVAPLLDATVFSVEVGRCKPDPLMYATICDALRVAPADCLYVGDGGSRELTGAAEAGMTAVRLAAPDLAGHLVFQPDTGFTGPSTDTLPGILDLVDRMPAFA